MSSPRNKARISVAKLIAIEPPLMVLDPMTLYSSRCPSATSPILKIRFLKNQSSPQAHPYSIQPGESPSAPSITTHQQWMTLQESKRRRERNEHITRNRSPSARRQPVRPLQTIVSLRRRTHRSHHTHRTR